MPDFSNHGPDPVTALRLLLRANGYRPVPVAGPRMRCKTPGKQPLMKDWRRVCASADEDEVRRWATAEPGCTNTGISCEGMAGVDIDVPVPELAERIERAALAMLGPTPLRRVGRAPKVLRAYRTTAALPKMETPELFLPDGTKVQAEVLGAGQQFVGYGTHPDTKQEYEWTELGPDVVPLVDLPAVAEADLREFVAVAERMLRAAGGRTKEEIKRAEAGPAQPEPEPAARRPSGTGGDFFKAVNRAALDNLGAWVPKLFPRAKLQATGAYRVASADLGRGYEEDLSIHPSGVQDFGPRKRMSPCDVVMEWGEAPDVRAAAFLLCDWLGRDPADFGGNGPRERKAEAGQRAEGPARGAERESGRETLRMYPARELMALDLPPLRFVVSELLPVGYAVLAGPPKLGKSWLAYQMALAVASGADLFGQATWQGEVLYLALEDGERRVQARMRRLLDGRDAPEALHVATKWPRLDKGGFEEIEAWAAHRRDRARLCIIDTSQKIKPPAGRSGNAYEQDYELHGQLHAQAHRLGIALVNITHMRKGGAKLDDWLEGVLGSGGITGSADTIIGLQRDRGAADAFLKITGRDVREEELALRTDEGVWSCLGAAEHVRMNETKQRILAAMAEGGDRGLPPKEIAVAAGLKQDTVRQTLKRMLAAGTVMDKGGGRYARRVG